LSLTRRELLTAGAVLALGAAAVSAGVLPPLTTLALAGDSDLFHEELAMAGPEGDMVIGSDRAPVTIIEYASLTSRSCAEFAKDTLPELKKRYIDTGKVRYIVREFPTNPVDEAGFRLARCGGPDKYEAIIETLFAKQADWAVQQPIPQLLAIAKQFGFTEKSFRQCLANNMVLDAVEWVGQRASEKFGVNSTPTFFINAKRFLGALPIDDMAHAIDSALKDG
jgi:protein-disulfide isomerase